MTSEQMRAHIVIRKDLIETIDSLVGPRARSKFIEEAAAEKLARIRLDDALAAAAGSLKDVDTPGWESPEAVSEWVRASRRADAERLERIERHG